MNSQSPRGGHPACPRLTCSFFFIFLTVLAVMQGTVIFRRHMLICGGMSIIMSMTYFQMVPQKEREGERETDYLFTRR